MLEQHLPPIANRAFIVSGQFKIRAENEGSQELTASHMRETTFVRSFTTSFFSHLNRLVANPRSSYSMRIGIISVLSCLAISGPGPYKPLDDAGTARSHTTISLEYEYCDQ